MGVSGCGKSTIGAMLGERRGLPYKDGDDLHPLDNIEKMAAGTPLTDDNRWLWLTDVATWLHSHDDGAIIGCSTLKRSYRDLIRSEAPDAILVNLDGDFDLLHQRMHSRPGHFMPPGMLRSQVDTPEPLEADEPERVFDIATPPEELVEATEKSRYEPAVVNSVPRAGNVEPHYSQWLAFSGASVTLEGEQRYLDSQLAYQRACLHAID